VRQVSALLTTLPPDMDNPTPGVNVVEVEAWTHAAIWVLLIQALAAHVCYITAKYACRIMVQGFGFALPITITVPMTVSVAVVFCGLKNMNDCYFHNVIPDYLFFRLPPVYHLSEFLSQQVYFLSLQL
jgi:chitin synthase